MPPKVWGKKRDSIRDWSLLKIFIFLFYPHETLWSNHFTKFFEDRTNLKVFLGVTALTFGWEAIFLLCQPAHDLYKVARKVWVRTTSLYRQWANLWSCSVFPQTSLGVCKKTTFMLRYYKHMLQGVTKIYFISRKVSHPENTLIPTKWVFFLFTFVLQKI